LTVTDAGEHEQTRVCASCTASVKAAVSVAVKCFVFHLITVPTFTLAIFHFLGLLLQTYMYIWSILKILLPIFIVPFGHT